MLAIRLARGGRKKYPTYRIVAAESSRAVTGKFVAILGHYNPHTKELVLKKADTLKYLGSGAQPSDAVVKLLLKEKIELPKWVKVKTRNKAPKKAEPAAPKAEVSAESTVSEAADEEPRVAIAAEENSEQVEDAAVPQTNEDTDITETAATEAAQAEVAEKAEKAGEEAALEAAPSDESQPDEQK